MVSFIHLCFTICSDWTKRYGELRFLEKILLIFATYEHLLVTLFKAIMHKIMIQLKN